ncbi:MULTISPECIES: glutathione peroxidase [Azohydromonas]|uniref:Glutathione peroxidase n=1 Tax=Azohydromonas lata TaxID=45677 RepID=A0ABU5I7M1_9BURK|nr:MULTISPECIES: hypothetical protein [Azohydromonas]MDZ5455096.1 glutathione peroxidase [Azohydromonas lata]
MGTDAHVAKSCTGEQDFYGLILERIDGRPMRLARYWGQVLLVVNVASRSPLATTHLRELQSLHERYNEVGLKVMGFPCNDFGGMEPWDDGRIQDHYERTLGLSFTLFSKVSIAREPRHPLFAMLARAAEVPRDVGGMPPHARLAREPATTAGSQGPVHDNFEKFLVGRDGRLLHRFGPEIPPQAPQVLTALEQALGVARNGLSAAAASVGRSFQLASHSSLT